MARHAFNRFRFTAGIAGLLLLVSGCGGGFPAGDLQTGLRRAQREKKLLLVEYTRLGCPHTSRMDREVFPDADVRRRLKDFVIVRRNVRLNQDETRTLGVTMTPTFLVYRSDGTLITRADGAMTADGFHRFLIRARINW